MTAAFWNGKKVLLTGHTGFKGAWLALWLRQLGAEVTGFSLPPPTEPNLFSLARVADGMDSRLGDVRDKESVAQALRAVKPDVVLHLAAQALVRASYRDPVDTYATNMMGTVHCLDALRQVDSVRVAVVVTTDKVYRNEESYWTFREDDMLGGHDPYSASKAACEVAVESYRASFLKASDTRVATARAGNVIGGGDWAPDRLIPDAVRAWNSGRSVEIRNPTAFRPWQHVLEPLHGYITLAERLWHQPELAGSFNFGPDRADCVPVESVIERARAAFRDAGVTMSGEANAPRESARLSLDNGKARALLGVEPVWSLATAVDRTVSWYLSQHRGEDAGALCMRDIEEFELALEEQRRSKQSHAV